MTSSSGRLFDMFGISADDYDTFSGDSGVSETQIIRASDGSIFTLGHLDQNSVTVKENGRVAKGQLLGLYADPKNGKSTGPHLHVDQRSVRGELLDPAPHLSTIMPGYESRSGVGLRPSPTDSDKIEDHKGYDLKGPQLRNQR